MWKLFHIICCVLSSYLYAYIAGGGDDGIEKTTDYPFVMTSFFETVFTISILLNFVTAYTPEGSSHLITSHGKICRRYLEQGFLLDFFTWVPFVFFFNNSRNYYYRMFYLIKIIRIMEGLKIFDVGEMMDIVKERTTQNTLKKIEEDFRIGND